MVVHSDEDLFLANVDELLWSVTDTIQDQLIQEEKAHETASQDDEEENVVVEDTSPFQEPPAQSDLSIPMVVENLFIS